jgi:hypothetical protein
MGKLLHKIKSKNEYSDMALGRAKTKHGNKHLPTPESIGDGRVPAKQSDSTPRTQER